MCIFVVIPLHVEGLDVYLCVLVKGSGFKPHSVLLVDFCLCVCFHMAALDALVQERLRQDKDDRCATVPVLEFAKNIIFTCLECIMKEFWKGNS